MRKGCCLGCLTVLLLIAGGGFGAGYFLSRMELLERTSAVDTARYLGGRPAVLLHVDSNDRSVQALVEYALASEAALLRDWILESLPYSATLSLEPENAGRSEMVFAMSMPRLAGLLEWRADPSFWTWFDAQEVDRLSREAPGLWVVHSHLPVSESVQAEAAARWQAGEDEALRLGGGHVAELLIDNRDGRAYVALEPLLNPPLQAGDLPPKEAPAVDAASLAAVFARIESAWAAFDMPANDRGVLRFEVVCPNARAAESLHFFAVMLRDSISRTCWEEQRIRVQGDVLRDDRVLTGAFTMTGIRDAFVKQVRRVGL